MITFERAREIVQATIPGGGTTEPYGYESPGRWFPVIAPERTDVRAPGVDKTTGEITWMLSTTDEYQDAVLVGKRPS
jgi:hypothetical protein